MSFMNEVKSVLKARNLAVVPQTMTIQQRGFAFLTEGSISAPDKVELLHELADIFEEEYTNIDVSLNDNLLDIKCWNA